MNVKKRFLTSALAAVMAIGMAVPAFAEPMNMPVYGTYSEDGTADKVIAYAYQAPESMSFTYSEASLGTWNPETHEYEGAGGEGGWTADGDVSVTVINHSNTAIRVRPAYTAEVGQEDVKVGFSKPDFTIATAVGTEVAEAPSDSFTVGMTGESAGLTSGDDNVLLGHVTLRVEAAE